MRSGDCNGKKSVLGDDVQNTVDFIAKDNSNYIYQPPCAAPTCTCTIHVGIISFGPISVVLHARYERSWAAMMKKRSGDRIKKCNGQANRFFSGGAFSPHPVHSGSCSEQLPDALFRIKKAPLQVCELDMTLIPLLMRFSQRLIVDGATQSPEGVCGL